MSEKDDALQAVGIAAAHHLELVELATELSGHDMSVAMLDAGDNLDVAIVIASSEGATLFEIWRAAKLPVGYIAALVTGSL